MYALKFIYFLAKRVSIVISVTKCQCIIVLVVLSVLAGRPGRSNNFAPPMGFLQGTSHPHCTPSLSRCIGEEFELL